MSSSLLVANALAPWIAASVLGAVAVGLVVAVLSRRASTMRAELEAEYRDYSGALSRERETLSTVIETMAEGVVVAEPDGRFVIFNSAARRIVDRDPVDVPPEEWPETYRAFHSDMTTLLDADELILRQAIRGVEPEPLDAYFRHDDGGGVHVRGIAKPVRDEDGALLGGALVLHDRTERRRIEGERAALIEDLESRNRELGRFTYTVSHELRSPLVTIKGFLGLLAQDAEAGNAERLALDMERITEAVDTMGGLLEDLLELSRSGVVVDAAGTVDLGGLIREVVRVLDGPIEGAGAEVRIADNLPTLHGDRTRLFEVFQNLIENALKFMGDQPSPKIALRVREEDEYTICCVSDNGIGIAEKDRERVFRVFERVETSVEGSGVGLALVKGIVEAHGGSVWVESGEAGVGSTFCFSLPRRAPNG